MSHVFALAKPEKYTMMIRRILNKLIARIGVDIVMAVTSPKHQKLIKYVERARKKVVNARQRTKLLALIGEEDTPKELLKDGDSDSEIEDFSDASAERQDDEMVNESE